MPGLFQFTFKMSLIRLSFAALASLLVGHRFTAEYAPSSRLATGQIGRNERHRIYASDHLERVLKTHERAA